MTSLLQIYVLFFGLSVAIVNGAPQSYNNENRIGQSVVIPIVRDVRTGPEGGVYSFDFETGDGIIRQESGAPNGPQGAVVQQGAWS